MDDELNDVFESLYDEFKKLDSKYNLLKRYCACLLVKKMLEQKACFEIDVSDKVNQLENENKSLKEKVDKLIITLTKFMQGSKTLETMFSSQMCVFNKRGLSYQPKQNLKVFKKLFC